MMKDQDQMIDEVSTILQGYDKFESMFNDILKKKQKKFISPIIRYGDILKRRITISKKKRITKGLCQLLEKTKEDINKKQTLMDSLIRI